MADTLVDPSIVNDFYAEFWSSEAWGNAEPNEDETLRAQAITKLIDQFVIPQSAAGRNLEILDLGCGRGWLTSLLSKYGSVLGIDPVPAAIERAKVLFPQLNVRIAESANLISEGFEGRFDLIVSSEVIEHIIESQKAVFVGEVSRLLKPGGFAILTTPRGEMQKLWSRQGFEDQPVEEWINEKQLRNLCESAQLRVIAKDRLFLRDFPYDWLSRIAAGRPSRLLRTRFAQSYLLPNLQHRRGIYQVVLLQRP